MVPSYLTDCSQPFIQSLCEGDEKGWAALIAGWLAIWLVAIRVMNRWLCSLLAVAADRRWFFGIRHAGCLPAMCNRNFFYPAEQPCLFCIKHNVAATCKEWGATCSECLVTTFSQDRFFLQDRSVCQDRELYPNARIYGCARMPGYSCSSECQDTFFCPNARIHSSARMPGYILLPDCQESLFSRIARIHSSARMPG